MEELFWYQGFETCMEILQIKDYISLNVPELSLGKKISLRDCKAEEIFSYFQTPWLQCKHNLIP